MVRQGSVISPTLFNFYINMVLESILNLNIGCKLGAYPYNVIAYADNITLLASTAKGLQIFINEVYIS